MYVYIYIYCEKKSLSYFYEIATNDFPLQIDVNSSSLSYYNAQAMKSL